MKVKQRLRIRLLKNVKYQSFARFELKEIRFSLKGNFQMASLLNVVWLVDVPLSPCLLRFGTLMEEFESFLKEFAQFGESVGFVVPAFQVLGMRG